MIHFHSINITNLHKIEDLNSYKWKIYASILDKLKTIREMELEDWSLENQQINVTSLLKDNSKMMIYMVLQELYGISRYIIRDRLNIIRFRGNLISFIVLEVRFMMIKVLIITLITKIFNKKKKNRKILKIFLQIKPK